MAEQDQEFGSEDRQVRQVRAMVRELSERFQRPDTSLSASMMAAIIVAAGMAKLFGAPKSEFLRSVAEQFDRTGVFCTGMPPSPSDGVH